MAAAKPVDSLSYEQAFEELQSIVGKLEQGAASLEDSLTLWERAEALAARCEEWLLGAKARMETARAGGRFNDKTDARVNDSDD